MTDLDRIFMQATMYGWTEALYLPYQSKRDRKSTRDFLERLNHLIGRYLEVRGKQMELRENTGGAGI